MSLYDRGSRALLRAMPDPLAAAHAELARLADLLEVRTRERDDARVELAEQRARRTARSVAGWRKRILRHLDDITRAAADNDDPLPHHPGEVLDDVTLDELVERLIADGLPAATPAARYVLGEPGEAAR